MEDKRFRVALTMDVHPGKEKEFERVWVEVAQTVADHPDNIGQWLSASLEAPGRYFIISDWPDEPTFRRFEQSWEHAAHLEKLRTVRAKGSMETMTVLHHLPGARAR